MGRTRKNKKKAGVRRYRSRKKVNTKSIRTKKVSINIAHSDIDFYRSPHLLDLSQAKFIEKVKPTMGGISISEYQDLPGGDILEKMMVFKLLSIGDNKIVRDFKKLGRGFMVALKKPFQKVDFTPRVPATKGKKSDAIKSGGWREAILFEFLGSVGSGLKYIGHIAKELSLYFKNNISRLRAKDEILELSLKQSLSIEPEKTIEELVAEYKEKNKSEKVGLNQPKRVLVFKWRFLKPAIVFLSLALIIVTPIKISNYWHHLQKTKGQVLGEAEIAMNNLNLAQDKLKNFDLTTAGQYLNAANSHFVSAQNELKDIKSFLTIMAENSLVSNSFRSGKNVLDLGENLSSAGQHLLKSIEELTGDSDLSLTSRIKNFGVESQLALDDLKLAQANIDKINVRHLPSEYGDKFTQLKSQMPVFIDSLKSSKAAVDFLISFLGDHDIKRYLVVFQNDNELRATGGFMGSFALLDLKSGDIKNISIPAGGTYDVRAGLNELLASPPPMQLINSRWEFQDANWWPDWPTSAQNIAWFYEKADGPTVDGVVAVNSDWLARILEVTGPIEMPDYNQTITAANFEEEIQQEVEINHSDAKQPKKILSELAPKILDQLLNIPPDKILTMAAALADGLKDRDILVYVNDPVLEKFIADNGWAGRLKDTDYDYLSVVATNIGGGKTDNSVRQKIYYQSEIQKDGSIINTVLVNRYHFGPIDENFTDVANRSYLRFYVPLGSKLITATGFIKPAESEFQKVADYLGEAKELTEENKAKVDEASGTRIYNENNKTVFGNWLTINPGQSQDLLISYKLPFKLDLKGKISQPKTRFEQIKDALISPARQVIYSTYIQKQAGANDDLVQVKYIYPDNLKAAIVYPKGAEIGDGQMIFDSVLKNDLFYFIDFKQQ